MPAGTSLIFQRGQLKASLTRFKKYLDSLQGNDNINQANLQRRVKDFEPIIKEFNVIQSAIENEEGTEPDEYIRTQFEDSYYDLIAAASDLLDNNSQNIATNSSTSNTSSNNANFSSQIRLPIIELPKFNGSYEQWFPFYDLFISLIDSNNELSEIQKFHYLKLSLEGEAKGLLQSLETSSDNYNVAWDLLRSRYDNKRIIVKTHLRSLFDIPAIVRESSVGLRKIVDETRKHLQALRALNRPVNHWDDIIVHLLCTKIDHLTNKEWENTLSSQHPSLAEMLIFLEHKCQTLEAINKQSSAVASGVSQSAKFRHKSANHVSVQNNQCSLCNQNHYIQQCPVWLNMPVEKRFTVVKARKLCVNCLKPNHSTFKCSGPRCRFCHKKHNHLLHVADTINNTTSPQPVTVQQNIPSESPQMTAEPVASTSSSNYAVDNIINPSEVILSTALVCVNDVDGNPHLCRALLDCGSQSNFIRKDFLKVLRLPVSNANISVSGVAQSSSIINEMVQVKMSSRFNAYSAALNCLVLDKITANLPLTSINRKGIIIPNGIKLADPDFYSSGPIQLLIGADTFWNLLCVGQIRSKYHPLLQKTHLGWVVTGKLAHTNNISNSVCNLSTVDSVNKLMERFWVIEENLPRRRFTAEEEKCEMHFIQNFCRDKVSGRFSVKLPFKKDPNIYLLDNKDQALKRFYLMEKKLERQPLMQRQYRDFMQEYILLGHMSLVKNVCESESAFYLPHHAVLKDSVTTKLRVVFDASAKSPNGTSLNDVLMVGPTLQEDVFSILLRFRKQQFVLTADITKMYRQIQMHEEHRRYQRVFWRNSPEDDVCVYELNTVTYGTAPASFLAVRCLHQLAAEAKSTHPLGSAVIAKDFYMDDLLTGANTLREARQIRDEVISVLSQAGFELRKWSSNSSLLLEDISNRTDTPFLRMDKEETTKTLGILWNSSQDIFQFHVPHIESSNKITKRSILSDISRVFDPLGLINPIIINAKILMQNLWKLKIDWDESVPQDIYTSWFRYREQLQELNNLIIPRKVIPFPDARSVEIHGFCDASERAYGACIYLRTVNDKGEISVVLLAAKSRVAPLKAVSLPRLELCGAILLAQLYVKVVESLDMRVDRCFFWADSKIVLSWISSDSKKWATFVANRVGEIQRLTKAAGWCHVISAENPADILSRGITPSQLIDSNIWWHGPWWLSQEHMKWPVLDSFTDEHEITELRHISANIATSRTLDTFINKFSLFLKLVRVTAYCLRFINNCKHSNQRISGPLLSEEIKKAKFMLIKYVQLTEFADEVHLLKTNRELLRNSKILCLSPFIDANGLLRVGGRLQNSDAPYETKHQILLPGKHHFTKLLIRHTHLTNLHSGVEGTLAAIRNEYWPIACRSTIRGIIKGCVKCTRAKPTFSQQIMGSLPKHRVMAGRPFESCGVDYCGPFYLKCSRRRNAPIEKAYAAIFVCCVTTAVHCELVTSLSTEAFIAALKRFVSRRGNIKNMYSDNGTNFVGANNELKRIHKLHMKECGKIYDAVSASGTNWHFIPPNSPHFGGLWEASVKSVKRHLTRIVGKRNLNFEELYTLLVQVEAILNSRPITPLSNDPNDLSCLTPGHFLIGRPMTDVVEHDFMETPSNRLSSWEHVQQMRQHFWSRWQREYLVRFQQRSKWKWSRGLQPAVGQLVIIRDDNIPPLQWKLGRIVAIHPGDDGVIRVATVRTHSGDIKRAVARLCVLPLE